MSLHSSCHHLAHLWWLWWDLGDDLLLFLTAGPFALVTWSVFAGFQGSGLPKQSKNHLKQCQGQLIYLKTKCVAVVLPWCLLLWSVHLWHLLPFSMTENENPFIKKCIHLLVYIFQNKYRHIYQRQWQALVTVSLYYTHWTTCRTLDKELLHYCHTVKSPAFLLLCYNIVVKIVNVEKRRKVSHI